ncbi:MAG: CoA pyrophosphatase [Tenuifilaceae bacterium]
MDSSWNLIDQIKHNLKHPLPGESAQLRMAPSHRGGLLKTNGENDARNSAVLISLFPSKYGISTLFIKRATYNGVHSGQISFPGGKIEELDESLIQTALRETQEEVGIDPSNVEVIGTLTPLFIPVSNMLVLPVIGLLEKEPELHLNLQEVDYTISIPICHLKNPSNQLNKTLEIRSLSILAPYFGYNNEEIWGATAMIISEFIEMFNC